MLKNKIYLLFIAVAALFVGFYFFNVKQHKPLKTLPYFEPKSHSKAKVIDIIKRLQSKQSIKKFMCVISFLQPVNLFVR